ncbi:TPA: hypothetical protein QDZ57_000185 [Stenotrophomonas maltophilia]|nr:hypothetical protein [Stenotrophomonas maltophilia]
MGIGSNLEVERAEAAADEQNRETVLEIAAELLCEAKKTGKELSDEEAVGKAEEHMRLEAEAFQLDPDAERDPSQSSLPELIGFKPDPADFEDALNRLRENY